MIPSTGQALDLDQAIAMALRSAPAVVAAQNRLEQANDRAGESRSGFFPQLRFSATAGQTNNLASLLPPGTASSSSQANLSSLVGSTQSRFLAGRIVGSWTVFDWGQSLDQASLSDLDVAIASEQLRQARQEAAAEVAKAFTEGLRARFKAQTQAAREEVAQTELEATRQKRVRGVADDTAVMQASAEAAGVSAQAKRLQRELRKADAALALLLGYGPDRKLELKVSPSSWRSLPLRSEVSSTSPEVVAALQARPDLRAARIQVEQEHRRLTLAGKSQLPTLALSGSGGVIEDITKPPATVLQGLSYTAPDLGLFATVSWDLFDGFRSQKEWDQVRLAGQLQANSAKQLEGSVASDVIAASDELVSADEQVDVAMLQADATDRALAQAQSRRLHGALTDVEVQKARTEAFAARQQSREAEADRNLAEALLAKAEGQDP